MISSTTKTMTRGQRNIVVAVCTALLTAAASAQPAYTFTSGPSGDGFLWPSSPPGVLDGNDFVTPDGIDFYNYTGNNLFFDSQYQVIGNYASISDDAMWANPTDLGVDIGLFSYGGAQSVSFDFAWAQQPAFGPTPDYIELIAEDSEGRATAVYVDLSNTFTGFGGSDGQAGRAELDIGFLTDDFFQVDGGPFIDIAYIYIDLNQIVTGSPTCEFGIDNLALDGASTETGEIFPSVNGGSIDVTDSILARTVLRGAGSYATGVEVTNGRSSATTFSTVLLPGGGLSDNGQASGVPIQPGQTVWSGDIVSIDKSLPSATYDGDVVIVNDLSATDPNNTVTLRVRIAEPPSLTTPSPVDVTGGDLIELSNAAPPANGHRASVKVTGTSVNGPFSVTGWPVDTPVKPGQMIDSGVDFDRFGRLSGAYNGSMTASLEMTFFVGANEDIETLLFDAEPVPDANWVLDATLIDLSTDSIAFAGAEPLGPGRVGTNSAVTAATIVGGAATASGSVMLDQILSTPGATTGIISDAVVEDFSGGAPVHAMQMTYDDANVCAAIDEMSLALLRYDSGAGDWELAIHGNSDSGAGATFYAGSFEDFEATLGGAPLATALSTYGLDTVNNRAWAIIDHEATFGVGEPGAAGCDEPCPGDIDGDHDVDSTDLSLLLTNFGLPSGATLEDGDVDGDGDVDSTDLSLLLTVFGSSCN